MTCHRYYSNLNILSTFSLDGDKLGGVFMRDSLNDMYGCASNSSRVNDAINAHWVQTGTSWLSTSPWRTKGPAMMIDTSALTSSSW